MHASMAFHSGFELCTLLQQVLGVTVQDMHVFGRAIDVREEVLIHERMIRLGVVLGNAYIFIHIESDYVLERNLTCFIIFHQLLVHAQRRCAGWQTKHKWTRSCGLKSQDSFLDIKCRPLRHRVVILFDDDAHILLLSSFFVVVVVNLLS